MKCMYCNSTESRVIDSRPTDEGLAIRRRRECVNCGRRFTTYEKIENVQIMVIKKDGSREAFDADKIRRGLIKACEKRPVAMGDVDALVRDVEQQIYNSLEREVSSSRIGEMVMERLRNRHQHLHGGTEVPAEHAQGVTALPPIPFRLDLHE